MNISEINKLKDSDLKQLQQTIDDTIRRREREGKMAKKMSIEELLHEYGQFGYVVPKGSKFWKIGGSGRGEGKYGMEVGRFTHSCHVDTTDLIVLLVIDGHDTFVEDYSDLWLSDPVTI